MAWAKRFLGRGGRVVVMTGDGELQEGQNLEALRPRPRTRVGNLWAIVDRNELQSDKPTEEILALGDLEAKLRAFGWHVETCDGHDHDALARRVRRAARRRGGRAEGARREHDQGQGRLVHGASARAAQKAAARTAGTPARPTTSRSRARTRSSSSASASACPTCGSAPVDGARRAQRGRAGVRHRDARASHGRVRRRRLRRSAARARRAASRARRARRRPRLRLPHPRRSSSSIPTASYEVGIAEQDMVSAAAGHGAPGPPAGRQLVRQLPRLARERADLQPGERADEGRLRAPLRRADPGRARASRTRASATSRCSPRCRT